METTIFLIFVVVYLAFVYWMLKEKLAVMWALIIMGYAMLAIAELAYPGSVKIADVYALAEKGPMFFAGAIMLFILANVFARSLVDTGIVESIIKSAAELGGDKPLLVTILVGLAIAYVTLGAYAGGCIVGIIIGVPLLINLGVDKRYAISIIVFAGLTGLNFWPTTWAALGPIAKVGLNDMLQFVTYYQVVWVAIWLIFVIYVFKTNKIAPRWAANAEPSAPPVRKVPRYTYFAPLLPLIFIIAVKMSPNFAFILSTVIVVLITQPGSGRKLKDITNLSSKAFLDGMLDLRGLFAIFIGVGFLMVAGQLPVVKKILEIGLSHLIPSSSVGFLLFFTLLMLIGGLFRGPGCPAGMGGVIIASVVGMKMYPLVVTGALIGVMNMFVTVCDATTGMVMYASSMARVSPIEHVKRTYIPAAIGGIIGMIIILILYMR